VYVKLRNGEEIPLYSRPHYQTRNQNLLNLFERYNEYTPNEFLVECSRYVGFPKTPNNEGDSDSE
jgi:hypothetical protein